MSQRLDPEASAAARGGRVEIFSAKPCPTCKGKGGIVAEGIIACPDCQGSAEPENRELAL